MQYQHWTKITDKTCVFLRWRMVHTK